MSASAIPVILMTLFWGVVGIVLPIILPKGPNRSLMQCILIITAAACWLFWLCCYMHQMNPLIGPQLHSTTIIALKTLWIYIETHNHWKKGKHSLQRSGNSRLQILDLDFALTSFAISVIESL